MVVFERNLIPEEYVYIQTRTLQIPFTCFLFVYLFVWRRPKWFVLLNPMWYMNTENIAVHSLEQSNRRRIALSIPKRRVFPVFSTPRYFSSFSLTSRLCLIVLRKKTMIETQGCLLLLKNYKEKQCRYGEKKEAGRSIQETIHHHYNNAVREKDCMANASGA